MKKWTIERIISFIVGLFILFLITPYLWFIGALLTGYYITPTYNAPFVEAHQRAVKTFVQEQDFGISRYARSNYWHDSGVDLEGSIHRVEKIHLIGLVPEKGKRFFESARMPNKKTLPTSASRKLTDTEDAAVEKIRAERVPYVTIPLGMDTQGAEHTRVIAPLYADQSCLKCHSVNAGDLLGAFDYHLFIYPTYERQEKPRGSTEKL